MKKTYIAPMTGTNEVKVSHFLCVSGGPFGKSITFSTETPGEITAD